MRQRGHEVSLVTAAAENVAIGNRFKGEMMVITSDKDHWLSEQLLE